MFNLRALTCVEKLLYGFAITYSIEETRAMIHIYIIYIKRKKKHVYTH